MGILRANKLLQFTQLDTLAETKGQYNVYFDGNLLLWRGNVSKMMDRSMNSKDINTETCVNNIITKFFSLRSTLKSQISIISTYIIFDGIAPKIKLSTQYERIAHSTQRMDYKKIKQDFKSKLKNMTHADINFIEPEIGEGEHIIFFERDTDYKSILVTLDTDVFPLAFKHESLKPNDTYMYTYEKFIDLYEFQETYKYIPKDVFSLILVLQGCDFVNSIFTSSMTSGILLAFQDSSFSDIFKRIEKYNYITTVDDVKKVLILFIELLRRYKMKNSEFRICGPQTKNAIMGSICDVYENILWSVQYFRYSYKYEDYNKSLVSQLNVDKFTMFNNLFDNAFSTFAAMIKGNVKKETKSRKRIDKTAIKRKPTITIDELSYFLNEPFSHEIKFARSSLA